LLRQADVVFFRATDNLVSKTIAKLTDSEYTHVGLVINTVSNMENRGIIMEADRFIKTRQRAFVFNPALHSLYRIPNLTDVQIRNIVGFSLSMEGTRYDYLQIFGFFLQLVFKLNTGTLFNRANYIICSELIDKALYTSGVKRNTLDNLGNIYVKQLLEYYNFQKVY
jgi:hypothetical protein